MVRLGRRNGSFPISAAQGTPPLRGILAWTLHPRRAARSARGTACAGASEMATSHSHRRPRAKCFADDRSTVRSGVDDDVEERSSVEMTPLSGLDVAWIDQE